MAKTFEEIAQHFLGMGIQHWGQSDIEREKATKEYVQAAGFNFPSEDGSAWLKQVLAKLNRGKFECEVEQLTDALRTRAAADSEHTF